MLRNCHLVIPKLFSARMTEVELLPRECDAHTASGRAEADRGRAAEGRPLGLSTHAGHGFPECEPDKEGLIIMQIWGPFTPARSGAQMLVPWNLHFNHTPTPS